MGENPEEGRRILKPVRGDNYKTALKTKESHVGKKQELANLLVLLLLQLVLLVNPNVLKIQCIFAERLIKKSFRHG